MRVPPFTDRNLRGELRKVDQWLRMLGTQMGRTVSLPQGTPSGGIGPSLGDYLYLPGRPNGQISYGRVLFQAKNMPAGGANVPDTAQNGFGWQANLARDGLTTVNMWIESTNSTLSTANPTREWVIPAFNEVEGDTTGLHYFVDASTHQSLTLKTFRACRYVAGATSGEGWMDNSESRYFHWSLENMTGNRNATTHANLANTPRPIIQIAPLDVPTGLGAIDNSHCAAIVKVPRGTGSTSTATPFEIDGVLHGGDTQREIYCAPGGAKAGYAGPSQGNFLVWNPAVSFTGNTNSNTNINGMSSTVGLVPGMRVRDTRSTVSYVEYFIVSVNSAFDITVSQAFSDTTVGVSFVAFGITYQATSGIDHGSLAGLADDDHLQYLNLNGRTGGQIISLTAGHSHSGQGDDDIALHGQLIIDPNDQDYAVTSGRGMDIRLRPTGTALTGAAAQYFYTVDQLSTGGTGAAVNMQISGAFAGSTAITLRGLNLLSTNGCAAGSTVAEATAGFFSNVPGSSGTGVLTWQRLAGLRVTCAGQDLVSTVAGVPTPLTVTNGVTGMEIILGPKAMTGKLSYISLTELSASTASQSVTDFWGIAMLTTPGGIPAARMDMANVVNWTFMEIPAAPANPSGTIRGLKVGDIKSHHVGGFRFGDTTTPTHCVEIAAGTTAKAPLMLTSGTSLTSPVAGAIEFTTDDFFATITTGPARKAFVLDDGTRLTSGRVPFATTNGRLTDDADMTFATDTLTVTKIAATTFTGDVAHDTKNITTDTTTGTKIGTATNQKLGFWNAAPVVQPTTAITAGTASHIGGANWQENDTIDGYTLGQVVAALRQIGILA